MLLSVEKYEQDRKARRERLAKSARFEEPDRVPVVFGIGTSYFAWLFDYPIDRVYDNPELQVEVHLKGIEWEYEYLKADHCTRGGIGYDAGPVGEAIVFGAEVAHPAGTSPRICHMFDSVAEAAESAIFIPPAENRLMKNHFEKHAKYNETARKMGVKLGLNETPTVGIHPPLSAACALVSPTLVYEAMVLEPEIIHKLLDRMYEAFVTYFDYFRDIYGWPKKGIGFGLADDNISMISNDYFREFQMPYYMKFRERYGVTSFYLHTDGPNDQHFKYLANEVKLTSMDIGGWSSLERAVSDMKGKVYIHGGLNCRDFYDPDGMSEVTKKKALDAIRLAAPGGGFELAIGGECYVRVSPKGIRQLVEFVEKRGKYPIDV
ncbi:MAG TPA: uroporphyrinogen decarboxylase family protein [Candidatus Brocadiia bacterium]|nr:uroporphyrinogen decarboxylase family protein [Candidatus Brocadiia bacterium]